MELPGIDKIYDKVYTFSYMSKALANTKNKTTINIKVDKDLKKQVDLFSDSIGISVSTMVNAYFRQLSETRKFEVVENFELSEMNRILLRKSLREYEKGEYEISSLDSFVKKAKTGKL